MDRHWKYAAAVEKAQRAPKSTKKCIFDLKENCYSQQFYPMYSSHKGACGIKKKKYETLISSAFDVVCKCNSYFHCTSFQFC